MKIFIEKLIGWDQVLREALMTARKEHKGNVPSNKWLKRILLAEHSPIRAAEFRIEFHDIPMWVTVHFVRHHINVQPYVSTQREDRTKLKVPRDELPQGELNKMSYRLNAQSIINISRKRLCKQASKETRQFWKKVVEELEKVEPILAEVCVPECIYRGFCTEMKSCGFSKTEKFKEKLEKYRKIPN